MKKIEKTESGRIRVYTLNEKPSRSQQQFKDQCDVNKIVARYKKTGIVTHLRGGDGQYGDFSDIGTYHEAIQRVLDANKEFMKLPAAIRNRFGNDPQQLMTFLDDPSNNEEAIKMGLKVRKEEPVEYSPPVEEGKTAKASASSRQPSSKKPEASGSSAPE